MSFADPQSVTISGWPGSPVSLPRVGSGVDQGSFKSNDNLIEWKLSSTYGKKTRRLWRFDITKTTTDPLVPAQNVRAKFTFYLVAEVDNFGWTVAEQKAAIDGIIAIGTASSGAKWTQWLGGEN